jgi:two-component system chemotaxis sensor kinase CheA
MTTHVLVVDDDPHIRGLLGEILEVEGYAVAQAADGLEALDALRAAAEPVVVLLDLMMPRLSGEGVLAAVAAGSDLARHRYVLMTTVGDPNHSPRLQRLLAASDADVLYLPFDIDVMLERIAQATRRSHADPPVH